MRGGGPLVPVLVLVGGRTALSESWRVRIEVTVAAPRVAPVPPEGLGSSGRNLVGPQPLGRAFLLSL